MQFNPTALPEPIALCKRTKALAMLDAIICPEWEYRYYSFDAAWGNGEQMASMRNGEGDEWFILFGACGVAIKGLAHETPFEVGEPFAKEIQQRVPSAFASFLGEPAFSMQWASFCYWRATEDREWHKIVHPDPLLATVDDGSLELLALVIEPPISYQRFANDYFECNLSVDIIEKIFAHAPISEGILKSLNPELSISEARAFAIEIGYPCVA